MGTQIIGKKLLPDGDAAHLKFILSGAFSLPLVLAAEFCLVTGVDSLSRDFIERHVDLCLALIFPAVVPIGRHPRL